MSAVDFLERLIKAGVYIYVLRTKCVIAALLVKNYSIKDE
ncbi:hypothetical protein LIVPclone14_161 [Vaccinia virus]|uniref:Uncharacterized protein A30.5 n=5 Tax=Vaccinia virus TaxID=10245 RepID=A305_VACCW|nr:hypothetical protein VACWR153.5 [Vaccinia virus]P0CK19.1 RecName: Full=Uncharacterized protein A30.5 [Vaccinia virus WR]UJQ44666.1 hypothetical protein BPXVP50A3_00147 [Buffalopox virus]AGB75870.1 hypothetical protein [Vaccinia virus]AIZ72902.1 hypothetical protein [Vaccinia virus]AQY54926.1 hypothetical protein LIVPclone14_161 [Vaccinia virus]AXN56213.1 hypothetical protein [Vaccinia virus]